MKIYSLQKNRACPAKLQRSRGFTLVETLVSISIFTMSILGLMSILGSSISNTTYAKNKITAEYLAQEGVEYVRNLRDTAVLYDSSGAQVGWNTFTSGLTPSSPNKTISCLDLTTCPIFSTDFPNFIRTITMSLVTGTSDEVKIISDVSWNQGSGTQHVILSENLYNWIE